MARSAGTRYPVGGASTWSDGSAASAILTAEFFGDQGGSLPAEATPTGVQAQALAGAPAAAGSALTSLAGVSAAAAVGTVQSFGLATASLGGVEATAAAGAVEVDGYSDADAVGVQAAALTGLLSADGAAVVNASSVVATASAGQLSDGSAPPVVVKPGGGGSIARGKRRHIHAPAFAWAMPPPAAAAPRSVPAIASVDGATATASAGKVSAEGKQRAVALIAGAKSEAVAFGICVKASARAAMPSAAANRAPAVVCIASAACSTAVHETKATGAGISDEEVLALLMAA